MRGRGLKLALGVCGAVGAVAPHAGAWIETRWLSTSYL